jgi:hypothetical protein
VRALPLLPSPREAGRVVTGRCRTPKDETRASEPAMLLGPVAPTPLTLWQLDDSEGESGAGPTDPQLLQGELARLSTYSRISVNAGPPPTGVEVQT